MSVNGILHIKGWEKFQHYKHRNPVWIKAYVELLDRPAYFLLTPLNRAAIHAIWLLAARLHNTIPADRWFVEVRIGLQGVDFQALIEEGWLEVEGDASALIAPLATRERDAMPETEKSRDRVETEKSSDATHPGGARSNGSGDLTDGQLMGLVRQHLYQPDGKAPPGYSDGRDVKIIRALRKQRLTGFQIADAIEGVRLMCDAGELGKKRPGEKLTMRALYNTGHGVRPLLFQAQEAVYKKARDRGRTFPVEEKGRAPEHIGATLDRLVPRKP